jgi:hypothetical protein
VYIIWWLYTIFGKMNFVDFLYLLTALFTLILMFYNVKLKREIKYDIFLKKDLFLIIPIVICIAITLFYPGFYASFTGDGASYLDLARRVVTNNVFSSNIIQTPNSWAAAQYSTGMIDHFFGYSAIAVFFALGDVSLQMAELMLLFAFCLALFPLYEISKKLFNRSVARIAVLLASISPILLNQIRLVGGPDVTSLLFTLTTMFLLLIFIEEKFPKLRLCLVAGATLFIAWYAWLLNGYLLILCVPFLFLLYGSKFHKVSLRRGFLALMLLILCFFFDLLMIGQVTLRYIGLPLPLAFILASVLIYKWNLKFNLPNSYIVFLATSLCLIFFASYAPRLASYPFIQFDASNYHTAQAQVTANAAQTLGILSRAFDLGRVVNVAYSYFCGSAYGWDGLLPSLGILTIFLIVASLARLNKLKETLLVFSFPILQMLLWILMSPSGVVLQPRYLLSAASFYLILTASTIELIISTVNSPASEWLSKTRVKISKRISLSSDVFGKICIGILILSILVAVSPPIYANMSEYVNSWYLEKEFNWNGAIAWIRSNTTSNDVMACVYADYFSWYTNRQTVFLWPIDPNANMSTLISLIRDLKINYLIVDQAFAWQFNNLEDLYESPKPFLGSTIVFMNQNTTVDNVIIYNVTNIAYGDLIATQFQPDWGKLENWQPLTFYSTGNITTSQDAVRFDLKVADSPWPGIASTFTFSSPENLSQYSSIEFWIMVPQSNKTVLEIYSATQGQNYFSYVYENTEYNEWFKVDFDLNIYSGLIGNPSLQNATRLNFIVSGLPIGAVATFYIKNMIFYSEEYVLKKG